VVATGKDTAYGAVKDFIEKVSWDEIAMISDADRAHFVDGRVFQNLKKQTTLILVPR